MATASKLFIETIPPSDGTEFSKAGATAVAARPSRRNVLNALQLPGSGWAGYWDNFRGISLTGAAGN
jgi:hypothetical protein